MTPKVVVVVFSAMLLTSSAHCWQLSQLFSPSLISVSSASLGHPPPPRRLVQVTLTTANYIVASKRNRSSIRPRVCTGNLTRVQTHSSIAMSMASSVEDPIIVIRRTWTAVVLVSFAIAMVWLGRETLLRFRKRRTLTLLTPKVRHANPDEPGPSIFAKHQTTFCLLQE
jgi:hypothetical protein